MQSIINTSDTPALAGASIVHCSNVQNQQKYLILETIFCCHEISVALSALKGIYEKCVEKKSARLRESSLVGWWECLGFHQKLHSSDAAWESGWEEGCEEERVKLAKYQIFRGENKRL